MRVRRFVSGALRGSKLPAAVLTVAAGLVAVVLIGALLFGLMPDGTRALGLLALLAAGAATAAVASLLLWFGRDTLHLARHNKLQLARIDARLAGVEGRIEESAAHVEQAQDAQLRLWRASTEETLRELAKLDEMVTAIEQNKPELGALTDAVAARHRSELEELTDIVTARHRSDLSNLYSQLEALVNLRADLRVGASLPPLRGWALSPDVAHHVIAHVLDRSPKLVVELGSGSSTALIGLALKRLGTGRLIAVEHDPSFAERTRDLIRRLQLEEFVTTVHAPLEPVRLQGEQFRWYGRDWLHALDRTIDLLVVDGPPATSSVRAREPAMHVLYEHLSADATVLLDDADRVDEAAILAAWTERWPQFSLEMLPFEKGAAQLHRGDVS